MYRKGVLICRNQHLRRDECAQSFSSTPSKSADVSVDVVNTPYHRIRRTLEDIFIAFIPSQILFYRRQGDYNEESVGKRMATGEKKNVSFKSSDLVPTHIHIKDGLCSCCCCWTSHPKGISNRRPAALFFHPASYRRLL